MIIQIGHECVQKYEQMYSMHVKAYKVIRLLYYSVWLHIWIQKLIMSCLSVYVYVICLYSQDTAGCVASRRSSRYYSNTGQTDVLSTSLPLCLSSV